MQSIGFSFLFLRSGECLCEASLLAVRRVLLDDSALCRLIDCLIGLREGFCAHLLADILYGRTEGALAANVENTLRERGAVSFLRVLGDCHVNSNIRYRRPLRNICYYTSNDP